MTIIKNEVKTVTTIALTTKDFIKVVENYKSREALSIFYPRAFEKMNVDDTTIGNYRFIIENLNRLGTGDTYKVIAETFGFDGWENAGHYDDNKNKYIMVVYSYGDTVN